MAKQYKVSRNGQPIGTFDIWGIKEGLDDGKLRWTDDFWTQGMNEWSKLEVIRKLVMSSDKAGSQGGLSPDDKPAYDITEKFPIIGLFILFVGAAVFVIGMVGNPDGSAVRQQVLMQQMTNGLLIMILGAIIAKK
jgi:hypothetical protein